MIEKLIRCTQCNQVVAYHGEFGDFGGSSSLPGIEWSPEDIDGKKDFFRHHGDHATEEIFVAPESIISDKPSYEPNKVSYFEASNGREIFLIRRTKKSLAQPACYEVVPGTLRVSNVSFQIQANDLRKQLIKQNGSFALRKEMAQKFIQAFQKELESIPPEKLSEEIEITEEGETPLLVYASLKEGYWQKVLQRCQKDLQHTDLQKIMHFIQENNNPGDVLSLVIQRELSIHTPELEKEG
jgi:hypothetical protein